ncbi:MAG: nuclear transport factor 2 family protein [Deltaproteobacteria bacterium]|nr:nuclear transport factor 2 family protein [Deltaproteobacteria bacterium]
MTDKKEFTEYASRFIDAWNSQDVERVVACYTDDIVYRDPNTRGDVKGGEAMRHYLHKLFAVWKMNWTLRDVFPFSEQSGAAVLWHASFRRADGKQTVEADGMDLVLIHGGRISRNEVYFDRVILAPLIGK